MLPLKLKVLPVNEVGEVVIVRFIALAVSAMLMPMLPPVGVKVPFNWALVTVPGAKPSDLKVGLVAPSML